MLTVEQQATAERLLPLALRIARGLSRDEEAEGIASVALCEAIFKYEDKGQPLEDVVRMEVSNAVNNWRRKSAFEVSRGLSGGAVSAGTVRLSSGNGRRVIRSTGEETANTKSCLPMLESQDTGAEWLQNLIALLPKRLQAVAKERWIEGRTLLDIALAFESNVPKIHRMCKEAEEYARLFLNGGRV